MVSNAIGASGSRSKSNKSIRIPIIDCISRFRAKTGRWNLKNCTAGGERQELFLVGLFLTMTQGTFGVFSGVCPYKKIKNFQFSIKCVFVFLAVSATRWCKNFIALTPESGDITIFAFMGRRDSGVVFCRKLNFV